MLSSGLSLGEPLTSAYRADSQTFCKQLKLIFLQLFLILRGAASFTLLVIIQVLDQLLLISKVPMLRIDESTISVKWLRLTVLHKVSLGGSPFVSFAFRNKKFSVLKC